MHEFMISSILLQATTNPELYLIADFLIYMNKGNENKVKIKKLRIGIKPIYQEEKASRRTK